MNRRKISDDVRIKGKAEGVIDELLGMVAALENRLDTMQLEIDSITGHARKHPPVPEPVVDVVFPGEDDLIVSDPPPADPDPVTIVSNVEIPDGVYNLKAAT